MRVFTCQCNNTIFFENSLCTVCQHELAWCPVCRAMQAIRGTFEAGYECTGCNTPLRKCYNYIVEHVCNRAVLANGSASDDHPLCDYCQFNDTIPDLNIEGNRALWQRLEIAKRRLLYTLDLLGLPYSKEANPPLSFDFKADVTHKPRWWWQMGKTERVFTGHANGKITINLMEADSIEREKTRVFLNEAHRTEIGHFRHEIGHYYWEMLITADEVENCKALFGDHENPTYSEALERHYNEGPPVNWQNSYVSAYATMHPWEDFAETFAVYLDMVSVLDTAANMELISEPYHQLECEEMIKRYQTLGLVLNEMNRAMGLTDLVPEIFVPLVREKLQYVHRLVIGAASTAGVTWKICAPASQPHRTP